MRTRFKKVHNRFLMLDIKKGLLGFAFCFAMPSFFYLK
jgi:hypothetical protein